MKFIFILTQDAHNLSVKLIQNALNDQLKARYLEDEITIRTVTLDIEIWPEKTAVRISTPSLGAEEIAFEDILLIMKRTWGPARYQALDLCQQLKGQGIRIINGCDFINWSHSKISQYKQLEEKDIFPKSLCYDAQEVEKLLNSEAYLDEILKDVPKRFAFPIVFKNSHGTKGSGVYLIESLDILRNKLSHFKRELIEKGSSVEAAEWKHGFLIQTFIKTHQDPNIALYYRINIINNVIQSAMQCALQWVETEGGYKKLIEQPSSLDHPINLEDLNLERIQTFITECPYDLEVVGIDVIRDLEGKYSLLELNDGPALSFIQEFGEKYSNEPCKNFIKDISDFMLKQVEIQLNTELRIHY